MVVDVQNYFLNGNTKQLPKKIADFISKTPINLILFTKFVNTKNSNFVRSLKWRKMFGAPETDIAPELKKFANKSNTFAKSTLSALKSKKLAKCLKEHKIGRVYLCGLDTDGCIIATAMDAFDCGYEVMVLDRLCASHNGKEYHKSAVKAIRKNIGPI